MVSGLFCTCQFEFEPVTSCDKEILGEISWKNAFSMILRLSSGVSELYIYPNVVVVLCRR